MTITPQLTYLKQKLACELTQLIDNYAAEVAGLVSVPADDSLRVAMIQAECALADIAEGEETNSAPNTFQWAEQHCAKALADIRPMMKLRDIPTSEWPQTPQASNQPSSESMPAATPDRERGLYAKYTVQHTDGPLVDFPSFVLRIDGTDPAALAALLAYANHPDCSTQLAADLIKKFNQAVKLNPSPSTTTQPELVAVSKLPWEQKGWCHPKTGKCWIERISCGGAGDSSWDFQLPPTLQDIELRSGLYKYGRSLPHHALPLPEQL